MISISEITAAEIVDANRYHVFTDKGIFLLDINVSYEFTGINVPTFSTVEEAVNHFNL